MDTLVEIFCVVDDFCQEFMPRFSEKLLLVNHKIRQRKSKLNEAEIMTILIYFHQSHYRDFKTYYLQHVCKYMKSAFTDLVSYNRFVELFPSALLPLCFFIQVQQKTKTGIYFVDSTTVKICHIKRAYSNRVFKGLAKKSKSTMGWYFGFKLHIIINDKGELMAFKITQATTDDRKPVPSMSNGLTGILIGDKGYISQKLFDELYEEGLKLITKIKKNMNNKFMLLSDKLLLRKRAIVETVIDQLKNISQIEHSRHRSPQNFFVNLLAGLAAYCLQPKKPTLNISNAIMIE